MHPPISCLPKFYRTLWSSAAIFLLFIASFVIYVRSETAVKEAHETRHRSLLLIEELRQSSSNLTMMARTYVMTKKPLYKEHFFEIINIRDGKHPRPTCYDNTYWELVLEDDLRPCQETEQAVPLLYLMHQSGFNAEELQKLTKAKEVSDQLVKIEIDAMGLIESDLSDSDAIRHRAYGMLHDKTYHHLKYLIMKPISDVYTMIDRRTSDAIRHAESVTLMLRTLFVMLGLLLLYALWQTMRLLGKLLGSTPNELHTYVKRLGEGDFSFDIPVPKDSENSVTGWIAEARNNLAVSERERLKSQKEAERLSRLYAALSQCNTAIIHTRSERDLFEQICRISVEYGGIKMAWIGLIDPKTNLLRPLAWYGEGTDYLQDLRISIDDTDPTSHGPSATACREDEPFWCQSFLNSPLTAPWRQRGIEKGWGASAALPLHKNGTVIGTLNLYAADEYAFDDIEKKLLLEMAVNIDFALETLRHEQARFIAEKSLERSLTLLSTIIDTIPIRIFWKDNELRYLGCNLAFAKDAGKNSPSEVVGRSDYEMGWKEQADLYRADDRRVIDSKEAKLFFEEPQTTPDGTTIWLRTSKVPLYDNDGKSIGVLGMYQDITAEKRSQNELRQNREHLHAIIQNEPECVKLVGPRGNLLEMNPAGLAMLEADSLEEAQQCLLTDYLLPEWRKAFLELHKEVMNGGSGTLEFEILGLKGTRRWLATHAVPMRDGAGNVTALLGITRDITERKHAETQIYQMANFDALTGLPNRRKLEEHFRFTLGLARRNDHPFALLFLDLDHFKEINDSLGHSYGDLLLIEISKRLQSLLREEDTLSRLGGDEFILLLPDTDATGAERVAQKILETITHPVVAGPHELSVSGSIGIALYPADGEEIETLTKNADAAMYRAKLDGRSTFRFFTDAMQARAMRNLQLGHSLRSALERDQFHLVYQPQICLESGEVIGAEALLRWEHPELGIVSPAEFIPVAESSGMIIPIGDWVLHTAATQFKQWQEMGIAPKTIAVNLSAVQFRKHALAQQIASMLEEIGLHPHALEIELTEGTAMSDPKNAIAIMHEMHERGLRISIDDFGTGYSSLNYLKQFKIYKLKIDQSFVRDILSDSEDRAIVSAIIQMAHSLGLETIAEGVENAGQIEYLRDQGCQEIQGYYISRPLLPEAFEAFMREKPYLAALQQH